MPQEVDVNLSLRKTLFRRLNMAVAGCLIVLAWLLFNHCSESIRNVVGNWIQLIAALSGSAWAFQGSTNPRMRLLPSRVRFGLALTAVSIVFYACGEAIWTYYELCLGRAVPFPSIADAGFLISYACLLTGVLFLPSRPLPVAARGRALMDGLIVGAAAFIASWFIWLGPTLLAAGKPLLLRVLGAAYPVADIVILVCLFMLTTHPQETALKRARGKLAIGIVAAVLADSSFGYLTMKGTYATGSVTDLGWVVANLFVALATAEMRIVLLEQAETTTQEKNPVIDEQPPAIWNALLPYALVPAAAVLIVYVHNVQASPALAMGVYVGAAVLVLLLLARQLLSIIENNRLYRSLAQAYKELEARNNQTAALAKTTEAINSNLREVQQELLISNEKLSVTVNSLEEANARLESLATTDGMTGLPNHRRFQERLREELQRARRGSMQLALLLVDVDHFKRYNDSFGHPAGDDALREVANLLREHVREVDFPARYGGEEFAVLLPGATVIQAMEIAERIRETTESHTFARGRITLSIGATHISIAGPGPERLIETADAALYTAKRTGRNRVTLADADNDGPDNGDDERETEKREMSEKAPGLVLSNTRSLAIAQPFGNLEGILQEPAGEALAGLLAVLDLHDDETEGHSQRVTRYSLRLAQEVIAQDTLLVTPGDMRDLAFGALLHDIGKIGVPDAILHKPGKLTQEEWEVVRTHPVLGAELVSKFRQLSCALHVVRSHHERWDGKGYPEGLSGDHIPLVARIFSIADTFDAMASRRSYKEPLPYQAIRDEVINMSGTQFDPAIVQAFLAVPEEDWEALKFEALEEFGVTDTGGEEAIKSAA